MVGIEIRVIARVTLTQPHLLPTLILTPTSLTLNLALALIPTPVFLTPTPFFLAFS